MTPTYSLNEYGSSIGSIPYPEHTIFLSSVIESANNVLDQFGVTLFYYQQIPITFSESDIDPNRAILFGLSSQNGNELIDIAYMIDFHSGRIKSPFFFADELVHKATQHMQAKKIERVFISSLGLKLDTRLMEEGIVTIDEDDYLRINDKRLISILGESENHVFSLDDWNSTGIIRATIVDGRIWFFDRFVLHHSNKAFCVDPQEIYVVAKHALSMMHQSRAQFYDGNYLILKVEPLNSSLKDEFLSLLYSFTHHSC